ncbi:MAG: AlkA N-terminal domain-containing protein, partial [Egibacteraceae bacterium]
MVDSDAGEGAVLRLRYRPPLAAGELLAFLAARAIPGVEEVDGSTYRRTVTTSSGDGVLELTPDTAAGHVLLRLRADDPGVLPAVGCRARKLFDLDADVAAAE